MSIEDVASKTFKCIMGILLGILGSSLVLFGILAVLLALWTAIVR